MLESARILLEKFVTQHENCSKFFLLNSTRLELLKSKLLENSWLEFFFPCLKSPSALGAAWL